MNTKTILLVLSFVLLPACSTAVPMTANAGRIGAFPRVGVVLDTPPESVDAAAATDTTPRHSDRAVDRARRP